MKAIIFNEHLRIELNEFNAKFLKALTVERGKEFAEYVGFESDLKVNVYFADPYSSLKTETNENTNRLIREFFLRNLIFLLLLKKKLILFNVI